MENGPGVGPVRPFGAHADSDWPREGLDPGAFKKKRSKHTARVPFIISQPLANRLSGGIYGEHLNHCATLSSTPNPRLSLITS